MLSTIIEILLLEQVTDKLLIGVLAWTDSLIVSPIKKQTVLPLKKASQSVLGYPSVFSSAQSFLNEMSRNFFHSFKIFLKALLKFGYIRGIVNIREYADPFGYPFRRS